MSLIDLTLPVQKTRDGAKTVISETWPVRQGNLIYIGQVYRFAYDSMAGTYLDLPGHIVETDDGIDAAAYPLEKLYRLDATVIHLDRADGSGAIHIDELTGACPAPIFGGAFVINALGKRRFDEIEERSVYLTMDAVRWIVRTGVHLLVSDVYESVQFQGVFLELFKNGIATVCYPINLHRLTAPRVKLTVLPVRFPGVTQLPCRVVAEQGDGSSIERGSSTNQEYRIHQQENT